MRSKTSWFNKEIMIQSFRNVGWIGLIYLVGLFFALPLHVLMELGNQDEYRNSNLNIHFHNVFSIMSEVQLILMFMVPILLAVFLFRYLQMKNASDFIHSLPVKRTTVFSQYVGIGVLYLVIPVVFNAIILFILDRSLDLHEFFTIQQIGYWTLVTIVVVLLVFLTSVLVGTVTGLSTVQGVLSLVFLLFPAGLMGLIVVNLDLLLFGFLPNYYYRQDLLKLSPITNAAEYFTTKKAGITVMELIIYLGLTMIFYGLGMWLYKRRRLESVSQAITFPQLRPIFKYGLTFCMMLFGGYYFGSTQQSMSWAVFGYVIGSLTGFFIAEMILQKTWRVFTHVKGYVIYAVVIAVAGFLIHFDVTGYQQKVPKLSQIKRVYFSTNSSQYLNMNANTSGNVADRPVDKYKPYFYQPKNIEAIENLHRVIINNKNLLEHPKRSEQHVFIAYELKNGEKVVREYQLPNRKPFSNYLNDIYNSKEYKESAFDVLHVNPSKVIQIKISPNIPTNKAAVITDPKVIAKAIGALKTDVMNKTYTSSEKQLKTHSNITILLDGASNRRIYMPFDRTYKQIEAVLKEQNMLKDARVTAKDISFAVVVKREYLPNNDLRVAKPTMSIVHQLLANAHALKITSPKHIQQLLDGSVQNEINDYLVGFQFKDQQFGEIWSVNQEDIPDFIKKQLK